MAILLSEGFIVTMMDDQEPKRGWVGVVDNRIEMVSYELSDSEEFMRQHPDAEVVECRGKLIMPGLINTHTHASMTLMRNYADNRPIYEWLNNYIWPFEAHQSDDDIVAGARLGFAEMVIGGTTTAVDMYMTSHNLATAAMEIGIRTILGECVIVEENLDKTVELVERCMDLTKESTRVRVGISPHAPYTCTPKMLDRCRVESERLQIPMSVHLCEGITEREMIFERYGLYPAQYLDRHGIINDQTILAHSIHLSDEDIELIAQRGATVSHSPQSNMKLASGVARVVDLMRGGCNVTLSTDGACSNNDLDMWEEMRTALLLQRVVRQDAEALKPFDVLQMATVNGAKAIGMSGELGVVAKGALADLIVVDTTAPHLMPNGNIYSMLVFCTKASDVESVIIDGDIIVREHLYSPQRGDLKMFSKEVVDRKLKIREKLKAQKSQS